MLKFKQKTLLNSAFLLALFSFSVNAFSNSDTAIPKDPKAYEKKQGMDFIKGKDEGWFFYKDLPPEVKKRIEAKIKKEMMEKEPPVGSSKWLQKELPNLRGQAIDNPTPANVKAYLLMERLTYAKSKRYAEATKKVVLDNPYLNYRTYAPGTIKGSRAAYSKAEFNSEKLGKKLSKRIGLWFFFNGGDAVAEEHARSLNRLRSWTGIEILNVSMNGERLDVPGFEKFEKDNGISKELKVKTTPTVFIFDSQSKEFTLLQIGNLTAREMLKRLVDIAHEFKWLTDKEYQTTVVLKKSPIERLMDANLSELNELADDPKGFVKALEKIMEVNDE